MSNPFEKPPTPAPEKREEKPEAKLQEKPKTSDELIKEDKDLRAEFFKLRERLEEEKVSQGEKKLIEGKLKEINKKCEPINKELNLKSEGLYSEIMDTVSRKKKGMSEEKWKETVKKSEGSFKVTEEKLGKMKDMAPNIKKYLEERIKQKKEQLGVIEVISSEPTIKEQVIEKSEKLEELKSEELKTKKKISPEEKIKEKAQQGKTLSEKDMAIWREIQFKKALGETESEIRKLREKKQRGEIFSKEEKQRLKILKLKWDILQRSDEIKEEKLEKEQTREDLEKKLEEKRDAFGLAVAEYKKDFGWRQKRKLKKIEKVLENAGKNIQAGDKEKLAEGYHNADEAGAAKERKTEFIEKLTAKGITKAHAEALYGVELKKAEYDEIEGELREKLKKEGVSDDEIFEKLFIKEHEQLQKAQVETWPPKEKNIFRKGLEWWARRSTATRLLISTGLITGAVAATGGFGAPAVAMFAGYRFVRGAGAVAAAKITGKGIDWAMDKGIKARQEASLVSLRQELSAKNAREIRKNLEEIFEEKAKKERRKTLIKAAAMVAAGGGAAIGLGMLEYNWAGLGVKAPETAEAPKAGPKPEVASETVSERAPEALAVEKIGVRGPQGAIIDYLRENPQIAQEKFGCPKGLVENGKIIDVAKFNEWTGREAHLLWLKHAKEALLKPEIIEQMKGLGYSADLKGYGEMMRRIAEGNIKLNPGGTMDLENVTYLKAVKVPPVEVPQPEIPQAEVVPPAEEVIQPTITPQEETVEVPLSDEIPPADIEAEPFAEEIKPEEPVLTEKTAEVPEKEIPGEQVPMEEEIPAEEVPVKEETAPEERVSSKSVFREGETYEGPLSKIKGIGPETQSSLDNLIYREPRLISEKVSELVKLVQNKQITVEDFSKYYAGRTTGAETISPVLMKNLENNFESIIENRPEARMSRRALEVVLMRLFNQRF